jgi:hypothetical protein
MTRQRNTTKGNAMNLEGKTIRIARFRNLGTARSFAARCSKMWLVLGDDGEFWAVRPVDAARLERAGYEMVR